MRDVARASGCCLATVSLALRSHESIPLSTQTRIRMHAERLGYKRNPLVSALMSTRRGNLRRGSRAVLGFLTNHPTRYGWRQVSQSYAALFTGARNRAEELSYTLEHVWLREPGLTTERVHQILETRSIHGLIFAPLQSEDSLPLILDWSRFCIVSIGYTIRAPDFHRVSHDYFHAMVQTLRQCGVEGHQRIGFLIEEGMNRVAFNLWTAAFLAERHLGPRRGVKLSHLIVKKWNASEISNWIGKNRLDALIGLGLWQLTNRGVKVPSSLHLINLNADDSTEPALGIQRDFSAIGAAAVDRMITLLHNNDRGVPQRSQNVLVEGLWI